MDERPRQAPLREVLRMVLSAFVGVRRRGDQDKISVAPLQVIIIGFVAAAVFVLGLVSVVRLITR